MSQLQFIDSALKMPLMELPVRSVLVTVRDRRILISPGSKTPRETYSTMPDVTDIVAPNLLHSAGVPKAAAAFPKATLWAVSGLKEKRADIAWSKTLTKDEWSFGDELTLIPIDGMPSLNEVVFIHQASRTLIVTDLCFNMRHPKGLGTRLLQTVFGTYNRFAVSRLFTSAIKDREAFERSMKEILTHDFDNIVMSHGDELKGGARVQLEAALKERGLLS
jgi:hypothetical protein